MRKSSKRMTAIIGCIILLSLACFILVSCKPANEYTLTSIEAVEKKSGKDFKIMLFTDVQLWTISSDNQKVFDLMDKLVEAEKPDLIVLPGDNVSGFSTSSLVPKLISKMDSYKIPWAPVYGNHDLEGILTIEEQSKMFEESEYCLFKRGEEGLYGMGNYAINIVEKGNVIYTLFMFDNGRYHVYNEGTPNEFEKEVFISPEQIDWYQRTVNTVNEYQGELVPSMTFSHFAMPEFRTAIETLCVKGDDGKYHVPAELGFGYCTYLPGVAPVNTGFIDTAKKNGTTHVFCGHDHENNASILYDGIRYTYGLKTGCSPREWNDAEVYGATVVTIGKSVNVYNNEMERVA